MNDCRRWKLWCVVLVGLVWVQVLFGAPNGLPDSYTFDDGVTVTWQDAPFYYGLPAGSGEYIGGNSSGQYSVSSNDGGSTFAWSWYDFASGTWPESGDVTWSGSAWNYVGGDNLLSYCSACGGGSGSGVGGGDGLVGVFGDAFNQALILFSGVLLLVIVFCFLGLTYKLGKRVVEEVEPG